MLVSILPSSSLELLIANIRVNAHCVLGAVPSPIQSLFLFNSLNDMCGYSYLIKEGIGTREAEYCAHKHTVAMRWKQDFNPQGLGAMPEPMLAWVLSPSALLLISLSQSSCGRLSSAFITELSFKLWRDNNFLHSSSISFYWSYSTALP